MECALRHTKFVDSRDQSTESSGSAPRRQSAGVRGTVKNALRSGKTSTTTACSKSEKTTAPHSEKNTSVVKATICPQQHVYRRDRGRAQDAFRQYHERMIRVMCVDDHPLMREGIATVIRSHPDMSLIAEASNGREAIEAFRKHRPDVTLMDLRLPDMSGIDALVAIHSEFPDARVMILTTFEGDVEMRRALDKGARSYLLKSTPANELLDAVRDVHSGRKRIPPEIAAQIAEHVSEDPLTRREIEILQEMAGGHRNRAIGERLFIAEETVKVHIKHLMEKLGAKDRTDAVAIGVRRGIIRL